jgi:hypothetical protein
VEAQYDVEIQLMERTEPARYLPLLITGLARTEEEDACADSLIVLSILTFVCPCRHNYSPLFSVLVAAMC